MKNLLKFKGKPISVKIHKKNHQNCWEITKFWIHQGVSNGINEMPNSFKEERIVKIERTSLKHNTKMNLKV